MTSLEIPSAAEGDAGARPPTASAGAPAGAGEEPQLAGRRAAGRTRSHAPVALTVVGVGGEILLTAGVVVLLFVAWQLWFNELIMGSRQQDQAQSVAEEWAREAPVEESAVRPEPTPAEAVVRGEPAATGEVFANLIVPRFGEDYYRPIAQGVDMATVLNTIGIGHYPGTGMPGEVGNFAVAAHRTTYGRPFHALDKLEDGDGIWVETEDGWYAYRYLSTAIVQPTEVGVIDPIPTGLTEASRYITLTTCHPLYSAAQRMIVHGEFEAFYPRAGGIPSEIAYAQADDSEEGP